jgi:hypothetical protein
VLQIEHPPYAEQGGRIQFQHFVDDVFAQQALGLCDALYLGGLREAASQQILINVPDVERRGRDHQAPFTGTRDFPEAVVKTPSCGLPLIRPIRAASSKNNAARLTRQLLPDLPRSTSHDLYFGRVSTVSIT